MKKLIAALLVLTMVLALTGTAMAGCKYKEGDWIKFNKNAVAYKTKGGKKTSTIVKKGSVAIVACDQKYDKWVKVQLTYPGFETIVTRWFKTADVKADAGFELKDSDPILVNYVWDDEDEVWHAFRVIYSQGGNSLSKVAMFSDDDDELYAAIYEDSDDGWRISKDCIKHVKIKANKSTWVHEAPCLSASKGEAIKGGKNGKKVTYRRIWGLDNRMTVWYNIKYKGKCNLWVSEDYTQLVK